MRFTARKSGVWRAWFAWHPIRVGREFVWLEQVERRYSQTFCGDAWEYRQR